MNTREIELEQDLKEALCIIQDLTQYVEETAFQYSYDKLGIDANDSLNNAEDFVLKTKNRFYLIY